MQNAVRNYSTLAATQIAVAFFSFASVWLVAHYLGTEGYGGIVAVIAAAQIAQIFISWSCVGLARYGIEEFVKTGSINKSFWARTLIFLPNTIVFLIFGILWMPIVSGWLKLPPEASFYVVAYFLAMAFWLHIQHALQGAKLMRVQGMLLAIERFLIFSVLLILIWFEKLTYLTAMTAYIAAPVIMTIIGIFQLRKVLSWRVEIDYVWLKTILKFSVPLIPFSLIGYFSANYLDAIFITQYLSKSDLGVYSIAYQINGIFLQFLALVNGLMLPLFVTLTTSGDLQKMKSYLQDILPVAILAVGLGTMCVVFLLSIILPYFFGQAASEIVPVLMLLSLSTVFAVPGLIGYIPYFNAFSASYIGTINAFVAAAVNLAANFILIPRYGLKGSAAATALSYGLSALTVLIIVNRKFEIKNKWTVQTVVPAILGIIYAFWQENLFAAVLIVFAATCGVLLIYRKLFLESVNLIINYRKFLTK